MHRYTAYSGPMPTTQTEGLILMASTTAAATKTYLQLATPNNRQLTVISWGFTVSSAVAGTQIELVSANAAATVTAHVASGLAPLDPNAPASLLTLGTAATGYNATAEGSITSTRVFDAQVLASGFTGMYDYQFMPDERPILATSSFLRIRGWTPSSGPNIMCWVTWDE